MAKNLLQNTVGIAAILAISVLAISLFANVGTGAYVSKFNICKDTDGGVNTQATGTCSGTGGTFTDTCSGTGTTVFEYSCLNNQRECTFKELNCAPGKACIDGQCI